MANKSQSKRPSQRSTSRGNISRNEGANIRRVQGGRADTGRDRGEGQGRDGPRSAPSQNRGADGRMGRRDGSGLEDERRPEERGDYRREGQRSGVGAREEPPRRGSSSWQGDAGRWEHADQGARSNRGERWAEENYRSRSGPEGRSDRESETRHGAGDRSGEHYRAQDDRDNRADWRPSMPSREFPRPGRAGREDAPYGEENREFRPQDWDSHGGRERDYGRTGRERYASDLRRPEGHDDDRYGPGWQGQSEFRRERDDEGRRASAPGSRGYGADERLSRSGDRHESDRYDDRERFGRRDDDREHFGRPSGDERDYFGRSPAEGRERPGHSPDEGRDQFGRSHDEGRRYFGRSYDEDREQSSRSRRGGQPRR